MKAFPKTNEPLTHPYQDGMDLRDYFAAKALQGLLATNDNAVIDIVESAYIYADAMMKEREKGLE
jgi:hypothetical protein